MTNLPIILLFLAVRPTNEISARPAISLQGNGPSTVRVTNNNLSLTASQGNSGLRVQAKVRQHAEATYDYAVRGKCGHPSGVPDRVSDLPVDNLRCRSNHRTVIIEIIEMKRDNRPDSESLMKLVLQRTPVLPVVPFGQAARGFVRKRFGDDCAPPTRQIFPALVPVTILGTGPMDGGNPCISMYLGTAQGVLLYIGHRDEGSIAVRQSQTAQPSAIDGHSEGYAL